jgi:predicted outer membrane repeat protein
VTRVMRSMAVLVGVVTGLGAAAWALPAAAQTPGGSTTTTTTTATTTPTTTPTTAPKPQGGHVTTQAACSASDATTYLAAIATASAGGCGATTQVITITASIVLTGTQGLYQNAVNAPLTIDGNGFTIDGAGLSRILTSNASVTTLNNLTLTHGVDLPTSTGGAIRITVASGNVVINGCTFVQNDAVGSSGGGGGGAISVGGGDVTVTNSTFTDNHTFFDGGAIRSHRPGSATSHIPVVTITGSTFLSNSAIFGDGGAIFSDGNVFAVNSTISGNSVVVTGHGGGITAAGINLAYTDVVGNTAGFPGNGSDLGIRHLHASPFSVPGTVNTFGSVITADPSTATVCSFDFPPANGTSFGYNWMSDNSCYPGGSATPASTDVITTTDPQLGPPADNGGPTFTELPASTSLLIDRIPLGACQTAPLAAGVRADQRGFARPSGLGCDIGAVEVQVPTVVVVPRFTG